MTGPVTVALGVGILAERRFGVDARAGIPAILLSILIPVATAAVGFLAWAINRFRRAAAESRDRRAIETAALEAGDLVGLGLAGGLSPAAALRTARDHSDVVVVPHMERLVASVRRHGVVGALAGERGPMAGIAGAIGAAAASGAPVLPALDAHLRREHHRRHTEAVEAARRLPVRLLIPLTLLVLPGFVLISVGPVIVESLARLSP